MTSERKEDIPNLDIQTRPNMAPAGPDLGRSPSWEEILAADPDHEKHLDTPEGRFEAVLNIVKNGAMVLEVMAMDRVMKDFHEIHKSVNKLSGLNVNPNASTTLDHLTRTISTVGAAARSDIDDEMWQLTLFGEAIKPAFVYVWRKIIELDIDPARALGATSMVKKDADGNIITTPPYSRAQLLLALDSQRRTTVVQLANSLNIDETAVSNHSRKLVEAGLVNFESVDKISDTYTTFKLTDRGKSEITWPIYQDSRGYQMRRVSVYVQIAISALTAEGRTEFSRVEVIDWIRNNLDKSWSGKQRGTANSALTFFSKPEIGLLQRSEFNAYNQSIITLTEKGRELAEILELLRVWSHDRNSTQINSIEDETDSNQVADAGIYKNITQVYIDTSPFKNKDLDTKRAGAIAIISRNPGEFTVSEIARRLGVSYRTVSNSIKQLIEFGQIQVTVGKGGRKYLSMAEQENSDQSVDNGQGN